VWRSEPLHAAALLVDQDRRFATERRAHIRDQAAQRLRLRYIALEYDDAPGLRLAKETAFPVR
jgi:hypothetical protein